MYDLTYADSLMMRSLALVVISLCAFVSAIYVFRRRTALVALRGLLSAILFLSLVASPMALDFLIASGNRQRGLYIQPGPEFLWFPALAASALLAVLAWRAHAAREG